MQIDVPKWLEVCIAGDLRFIVVIDSEDDTAQFQHALATTIGKSCDVNEIDPPLPQ